MQTLCSECGMMVGKTEYHPYAACLMFKGCRNGAVVRANLNAVLEKGKIVVDNSVSTDNTHHS